ncbi:MAG: hypothetical protein KatS3mg111_2423 [Pirellulaceae bacterium]|nr:MAG: hypothetical protein KatS3mg111_2423 [Pirellulaceae bacterium]
MIRRTFLLAALLFGAAPATITSPSSAADNADHVPDGPWISSVAWLNDAEVVGAKSQGLLLRPAQVVKAKVEHLEDFQVLGEAGTSLWKVLPLPDGRIAASDYRGVVHLFGRGEPQRFEADLKWVRAMALAPGNESLLVGTEDGQLVVLSVDQLQESRRVNANQAAIFDVEFNAAGDRVATASGDGTIGLFTWPELEAVGRLSRGEEGLWAVCFTPDGQHLLSAGSDRRIQLWDLNSRESVCTIAKAGDWVSDLVLLPDSSLVVGGAMDGKLVVADYHWLTKVTEEEVASSAIWSLALSPDGSRLVVGTRKSGFVLAPVGDWKSAAAEVAAEVAALQPPAPKP